MTQLSALSTANTAQRDGMVTGKTLERKVTTRKNWTQHFFPRKHLLEKSQHSYKYRLGRLYVKCELRVFAESEFSATIFLGKCQEEVVQKS